MKLIQVYTVWNPLDIVMYGGPGMDWGIEKLVFNCEMCQINQPMQSESPNSPLEMNKQPKGQSD